MAKEESKDQAQDLPCGVTQAQIKQWKGKYKEVHLLTVEAEEGSEKEFYQGYFRRPDLKVIEAATGAGQGNIVTFGRILFKSCFLAGDEELQSDEEAQLQAYKELSKIFRTRVASLKKL